MSPRHECDYSIGCPIEPYIKKISLLEGQAQALYLSTRFLNQLSLIKRRTSRAEKLQRRAAALEKHKNRFLPCPRCIYQ